MCVLPDITVRTHLQLFMFNRYSFDKEMYPLLSDIMVTAPTNCDLHTTNSIFQV
jgi:hypothetical protein